MIRRELCPSFARMLHVLRLGHQPYSRNDSLYLDVCVMLLISQYFGPTPTEGVRVHVGCRVAERIRISLDLRLSIECTECMELIHHNASMPSFPTRFISSVVTLHIVVASHIKHRRLRQPCPLHALQGLPRLQQSRPLADPLAVSQPLRRCASGRVLSLFLAPLQRQTCCTR